MSRYNFKAAALLTAVLLLGALFFPMRTHAQSAAGYTIGAYDVGMAVHADNTVDVTERITADFSSPRHGIIRWIPVSGTTTAQVDGRVLRTPYHNGVQSVSVTDGDTGNRIPCSQSQDNGAVELKIGSSDRMITGQKTYVIRYRYLIGDSGRESTGYDVLYYNLIGTGWDTSVSKVTFTVSLPASFDAQHLSFTAGAYGTADSSVVNYRVDGTVITGGVTRSLTAGEGLTMRLQLPKGYFASRTLAGGMACTVIVLVLGLISFLFFRRFGHDGRLYVPVEVAPPDGLNSAEAGYIVDGHADVRDVVSLLIYWADEGYLSISSSRKGNFTLHRLKEPDGSMKPYEAKMFRRLFRDGDDVKASQLQNSFYSTVAEVRNELAGSFLRADRRLFTRSGDRARVVCYLLAGLAPGVAAGRAAAVYFFSAGAGLAAGAVVGVLSALIAAFVGYFATKDRATSKVGVAAAILLDVLFLAIAMGISVAWASEVWLCMAAAISALVSGVAGAYAQKRTEQGAKWLGQMMGLRKFILLVEKKRLEMMVGTNPTLFYHILPYAYVLGVTDKWAKQFESIAVPPPTWFDDETGYLFSTVYFCSLLDRNMSAFQTNMVSMPQSSSGSSGGGFSGGGMGGGGGSSW